MRNSIRMTVATFAGMILAACGGSPTEAEATEAAAKQEASGPSLSNVSSGTYSLDKGHGYILMTYDHQGFSSPYIRFVGFDAELTLNVEDPLASSVAVTIDPSTVDSGVQRFDDHLKSADFFDVANNGDATFVSTGLAITGDNAGSMTGDLTIKGITRKVTLDVTFNKADQGRGGDNKVGFSARGMVKRSDWGLDLYAPFVSDDVELIIETEFVQK